MAEMGTTILRAETTAETFGQSAEEDPRMVVGAAAAAQKATDLVLEGQR